MFTYRLRPTIILPLSTKKKIPTTYTMNNYNKPNISSSISNIFFHHQNKYYFYEQKSNRNYNDKKQTQKAHTFDQKSSYFDILGVSPHATDQEIKSAYLDMVKKYHPDLSKEENASEKFQLIQKAYQVLSDPQQRSKHRQTLNIPNPQIYESADEIKNKFKDFKRKQRVPDEWQFSYKLFKTHYENVDAKQKEYTRFQGQGDQYWVHKNEMNPDKKVYIQQAAMIAASIGIAGAALYYMWK